ncbi:hypothetical protein HK101_004965, partial [Irineochytrium annulatum]
MHTITEMPPFVLKFNASTNSARSTTAGADSRDALSPLKSIQPDDGGSPVPSSASSTSSFSSFAELDNGDDLCRAWKVCTKVKDALEHGSRLENLSWRLWFEFNRKNVAGGCGAGAGKETEKQVAGREGERIKEFKRHAAITTSRLEEIDLNSSKEVELRRRRREERERLAKEKEKERENAGREASSAKAAAASASTPSKNSAGAAPSTNTPSNTPIQRNQQPYNPPPSTLNYILDDVENMPNYNYISTAAATQSAFPTFDVDEDTGIMMNAPSITLPSSSTYLPALNTSSSDRTTASSSIAALTSPTYPLSSDRLLHPFTPAELEALLQSLDATSPADPYVPSFDPYFLMPDNAAAASQTQQQQEEQESRGLQRSATMPNLIQGTDPWGLRAEAMGSQMVAGEGSASTANAWGRFGMGAMTMPMEAPAATQPASAYERTSAAPGGAYERTASAFERSTAQQDTRPDARTFTYHPDPTPSAAPITLLERAGNQTVTRPATPVVRSPPRVAAPVPAAPQCTIASSSVNNTTKNPTRISLAAPVAGVPKATKKPRAPKMKPSAAPAVGVGGAKA